MLHPQGSIRHMLCVWVSVEGFCHASMTCITSSSGEKLSFVMSLDSFSFTNSVCSVFLMDFHRSFFLSLFSFLPRNSCLAIKISNIPLLGIFEYQAFFILFFVIYPFVSLCFVFQFHSSI